MTDLIGRDDELKALEDWANSKQRISIITLYGEGGVGKTRLAFEFAEKMRDAGWEAGQLASMDASLSYCFGEQGILLIIDYPEEQTKQIRNLLKAIKKANEPDKNLRILFMSRSTDFISNLTNEVSNLFDPSLPLHAVGSNTLNWQLFRQAWEKNHSNYKAE